MNIGDRFPHIEVVEGELVDPDEELYTDHTQSISLDSDELLGDELEPGYGETQTELELAHTIESITSATSLDQTLTEFYAELEQDEWIE